jgi:hypothetical protein
VVDVHIRGDWKRAAKVVAVCPVVSVVLLEHGLIENSFNPRAGDGRGDDW